MMGFGLDILVKVAGFFFDFFVKDDSRRTKWREDFRERLKFYNYDEMSKLCSEDDELKAEIERRRRSKT